MAKHQPHVVRAAIQRYHELYPLQLLREDAISQVANEQGVPPTTLKKWLSGQHRKNIVAAARAEDARRPTESVSLYSPFAIEERTAKVELTREVTTEVFLSDVHWHPEPSIGHDEAAYAVALELIKDIQPDILFFGGDVVDCYAASRYDKKPRLGTPEAFKGEIHFAKQRMTELRRALPNTRFIWLMGNHELRIPKSVYTNAPWLAEYVTDVSRWLELDRYGCESVSDGYQIGKLRHYHGDRLAGSGRVNTAKNKFERMLCNMIFGHHHKFSSWYQRDQDGSYLGAFGNGCLQWLSVEYAEHPDWTQGLSVIQYGKSGAFHVDQVLIHKPSVWSKHAEAIYGGKHYRVNMERVKQ